MRRSIVLALVACLLGAFVVLPAEAAKKKKKPVTFKTEGSFAVANPATIEQGGVVQNELTTTCAIPASQGTDGYVITLPAKVSQVISKVSATGGDTTGVYDIDMYFYDKNCVFKSAASTAGDDEVGAMPSGTKYVVVSAFWGVGVDFTFESVEMR